ncbi:hypothetical protein NDU88_005633 [Pleurodeles waltl]|uniref:DDE Tnp4 domain-containing protein n=1 Tax=Pleurodeles waltl TaxID=8319 RepID=A0AAV7WC00_PLEWA|nr:hypothetical protein NDU88_005633 [Pleurodeles waltl]
MESKLTDPEDRSRRNNVRFLGFPESIEGTDILSYLRDTLPKLADITFDPPLEFQRAHRLGLKRQNGKDRPRPIIACFLRHGQVRQLLQLSRRQGPLRLGPLEIRLSADFSKETADRRRAFLSLRPRLRHLDIKFGLFEPARMWITKNGESRTFYDPEDLKSFLEGLHDPTQPMESTTQSPQDTQNQTRGMGQSEIALDTDGRPTTDPQTRGRDLERLTKSDSGYPNLSWLLTPMRNPRTRAEERYNEAHGRTRRIIERTFGLLKARFRCLHLTGGFLYYSPKKVCQIIVACCMLHNLALRRQVPFLQEDEPGDGSGGACGQ